MSDNKRIINDVHGEITFFKPTNKIKKLLDRSI